MKTPQIPIPKLAESLRIPNEIWLKREDEHHYGSHKGRSIPLMIEKYHATGVKDFVISSSGNAALAAALYVQAHNKNKSGSPIRLRVFVGKKIDPPKLRNLKNLADGTYIILEQVADPKRRAMLQEKSGQAKWLRQSTDDMALLGYHELAQELAKINQLAAVFIPTSSGATAQGLHEGFIKLGLNPQIHIVQTTYCHPMVTRELPATSYQLPATSLATAIVDRVARRKPKILELLKNSRGHSWIATNEEIKQAIQLVKQTADIEISPNSALSVVGLIQAIKRGSTWPGPVVCLITGA